MVSLRGEIKFEPRPYLSPEGAYFKFSDKHSLREGKKSHIERSLVLSGSV